MPALLKRHRNHNTVVSFMEETMNMTQSDIRVHYEQQWQSALHQKTGTSEPRSDVLCKVQEPIYKNLLRAHLRNVERVLDVGSGSGHWLSFFMEQFSPKRLVGVDFTQSSVDFLKAHYQSNSETNIDIIQADITETFELPERFDCINIANVLFHIPEDSKFDQTLQNLRKLVDENGVVVTTEYLPEITYRTKMMKVRSASEFQKHAQHAGFCIAAVKPCYFFSGHAMGTVDETARQWAHTVFHSMNRILEATDEQTQTLFREFMALQETALLSYLETRLNPYQFPGQKLVVLKPL